MCQTEAGDGGGQEPAEERELGPQGRAREGREGASGSGTWLCPLLPHQEIASTPTPDPSGEPLPGQGGGRAFRQQLDGSCKGWGQGEWKRGKNSSWSLGELWQDLSP